MLTGRRLAYVGGIAAATAAGAAGAILLATATQDPQAVAASSELARRLGVGRDPHRVEAAATGASLPTVPQRAVAQLAEHRSPKPQVGGSSPSCPASPPTTDTRERQTVPWR